MFEHELQSPWRRRLLVGLGGLILAACSRIEGMAMTTYKAEEFFDGQQLEVARAIDRNDMAAVRKLAGQGADLSTPGRREMSLIWYAAGGKDAHMKPEAIKTLVSLGVDPDAYPAKGLGSVLYASLRSRLPNRETEALRALLDGGLNPNHRFSDGTSLLQGAVEDGDLPHVKLLVERGAKLDVQDSIGGTAFSASSTKLRPDIGIYLIQKGANFNTMKTNGVTPSWSIKLAIEDMQPPLRTQFEQLRDMLIAKGTKWPPDPPPVVREQMRAKGMRVVPAIEKQ